MQTHSIQDKTVAIKTICRARYAEALQADSEKKTKAKKFKILQAVKI